MLYSSRDLTSDTALTFAEIDRERENERLSARLRVERMAMGKSVCYPCNNCDVCPDEFTAAYYE